MTHYQYVSPIKFSSGQHDSLWQDTQESFYALLATQLGAIVVCCVEPGFVNC